MAKNLVFYTIASTIVAVVAQALGANMAVVLISSLLIPPVLLLIVLILRYNGYLWERPAGLRGNGSPPVADG